MTYIKEKRKMIVSNRAYEKWIRGMFMEETSIVGAINKETVVNVEKALAQLNKHIFTVLLFHQVKRLCFQDIEMERYGWNG